MQEVKKPRKPLIYYYVIVLLVLLLFNFLAMPWIAQRQIREVDYGTFMDMQKTEKSERWRCSRKIIRLFLPIKKERFIKRE